MTGLVRNHVEHLFSIMERKGKSAHEIHMNNLAVTSPSLRWMRFKSNKTCFFCLANAPEHVLECQHAMCDGCVRRSGELLPDREHSFRLRKCGLCQKPSDLIVQLKPPTVGVRLLSVDGGGVRGIVPLEFLELLQESFGDGCSLQDFFDIACGTSAGGLIILGLLAKGRDLSHCVDTFRQLASRFFGETPAAHALPFASKVQSYIRCLLNDSCYNADVLESALQDSFGRSTRVLDHPAGGLSRHKIAITATNITDASPFIFTNYNGGGSRSRQCGYRHFRPTDIASEPLLWEAGRATSAAPVLFEPATLSNIGTFQDGGLRHNNPVNIGLWEAREIWPASTTVDVVLSLGTGTTQNSKTPQAPSIRDRIKDGFIPRLCRSFLTSLDGELIWRDLSNHLSTDARTGYFRLNIPLTGTEPRLDDVRAIEGLRTNVQAYKDDPKLQEIKLALLASSFFFELDAKPQYDGRGLYVCKGSIRIRGNCTQILSALRRIDDVGVEFSKDREFLSDLSEQRDICTRCRKFNKRVTFHVRHPSEVISMYLNVGHKHQLRISGFPHSMEWFAAQQQLDLVEEGPTQSCRCMPPVHISPLLVRKRKSCDRTRQDTAKRRRTFPSP